MEPFLFECPNTGLTVRGWIDDPAGEVNDNGLDAYTSVACAACAGVHMVNAKSRKVFSGSDEPPLPTTVVSFLPLLSSHR